MKHFTIAAVGLMAVITLGWAGAASAQPVEDPSPVDIQGASAADTISSLQAQGYNVRINGEVTGSLADCKVAGVEGLSAGPIDPNRENTVYVDVTCSLLTLDNG